MINHAVVTLSVFVLIIYTLYLKDDKRKNKDYSISQYGDYTCYTLANEASVTCMHKVKTSCETLKPKVAHYTVDAVCALCCAVMLHPRSDVTTGMFFCFF